MKRTTKKLGKEGPSVAVLRSDWIKLELPRRLLSKGSRCCP